jgi:hypothetical protein
MPVLLHTALFTDLLLQIIYFAQAKIDVKFKHDLKKKVPLIVNERFGKCTVPLYPIPLSLSISNFPLLALLLMSFFQDQFVQPSYSENHKSFLLTKGKLHAKVWLDKNIYFPGNENVLKRFSCCFLTLVHFSGVLVSA